MGCREAIFINKSTINFPIFLLSFSTKFPIFPVFSILSFLFSYFFLSNHAAGHPEIESSTLKRTKDIYFIMLVLMHYRMLAVDWFRITCGNDWRPMQNEMATSLARSRLHLLIARLHGLSICCLRE